MSAQDIQFPQGPFIDPYTQRISLEWEQWLQNPQYLTLVLGVALGVSSGGTGISSGISGGVLGFTDTNTLASSSVLDANSLVIGGGDGNTPYTLSDVGTTTTVLHGNEFGDPTWALVDLTDEVTGTLQAAQFPALNGDVTTPGGSLTTTLSTVTADKGGTGQTSYAVGDLLYASATTALSKLADVAAGSYLRSGGVTTAPLWSALKLPNAATSGRVVFASAADTYGEDADLSFDTSTNQLSSGTFKAATTIGVGAATPATSGAGITFPATQSASTDANTLDDYEEGTFTPGISFGGGTTGITYSTQTGVYTKVGNVVTFAHVIRLTSKGSSTGTALGTGLPFSAAASPDNVPCSQIANLMAVTATTTLQGGTIASATTIAMNRFTAGAAAVLTDADFNNNTVIRTAGSYFI